MRVVMLSTKDYAGSGRQICEATRKQGIESLLFTLERHKYGYKVDGTIKDDGVAMIQNEVNRADIIHFKGDDLPRVNWYGVTIPEDKTTVITVGGSAFRRLPGGTKGNCAKAIHPLSAYFTADLRTTITPDLNYPEFESMYTQHCINSKAEPYTWRKTKVPVIMHAPSLRKKKGTDIILLVMQWLRAAKIEFDFRLIENVSNEQCIRMKKDATIYIDQLSNAGFYGISAVEAMQFGIPSIAYISNQAIEQSEGKLIECPVISPYMSAVQLYEHLKYYLTTPGKLEDLSYLTKAWCDDFHSHETVGKMWAEIYNYIN